MGMGYYTCCYGDLLGQTRLGVGGRKICWAYVPSYSPSMGRQEKPRSQEPEATVT